MLISYAQNFEDVILLRALKHVERGFYIDIGAQHPVVDSVSLAFYEKGWRGVHVEPIASYAEELRQARPDETVIQAAIGTSGKSIVFWDFPDTGLSTGDAAIAAMHEKDNRKSVRVQVPCIRLSRLLSNYRNRDIHWLKIDVEGMERAVIESWRPAKIRPWIVVIESTKPLSPQPAFAGWEPLLLKLGYKFVYFDGLNRFYVSFEHPELEEHFGPGPNCFDQFALSGRANAPFCARINAEAETLRMQAAEEAQRLAARLDRESHARQSLETRLDRESQARQSLEMRLIDEINARTMLEGRFAAYRSRRLTARLRNGLRAVRSFARASWARLTTKTGSRSRHLAGCLQPADAGGALVQKLGVEIMSDLGPLHDISPTLPSDAVFSEREQYVYVRLRAALKKRSN
jgi:FkbM family methyltransferase